MGMVWLVAPVIVQAQLPARNYHEEYAMGKQMTLSVFPVLKDSSKIPVHLFTVQHAVKVFSNFNLFTEVSTIERVNPTAAGFASRSNHVYALISVRKKWNTDNGFFSTIGLTGSCLKIWDLRTHQQSTHMMSLHASGRTSRGASVGIMLEERTDYLSEEFSVGEALFKRGKHHLPLITIDYRGSDELKFLPYVESHVSTYYGYPRFTVRAGERAKLFNTVTLSGDIEMNRIYYSKHVDGVFTRLQTTWQVRRNLVVNVLGIYNGYAKLSALMGSAEYKKLNHFIRFEYRELRDQQLHCIDTSQPWFASRVLVYYAYRFSRM